MILKEFTVGATLAVVEASLDVSLVEVVMTAFALRDEVLGLAV